MWEVVTLAAFLVVVVRYAYERITHERERLAEIRRSIKENVTPEEMQEHLITLNKIMLGRMVWLLILFLPLIYALNSLGDIATPLGTMSAVWWFLLSSIVVGFVWGGVEAWIRRRGGSKR